MLRYYRQGLNAERRAEGCLESSAGRAAAEGGGSEQRGAAREAAREGVLRDAHMAQLMQEQMYADGCDD